MMNIMAEQHFDLHGRDNRLRADSNAMMLNPALSYSMVSPAVEHGNSNEMYMPSMQTSQPMPPISALPQIVFSNNANYNTAANIYQPKVLYSNGPGNSFTDFVNNHPNVPEIQLTKAEFQNSLHVNTNIKTEHQDALSADAITPQSMLSKNSFSSLNELRFPEASDSMTDHTPTSSIHTRSSYDASTAQNSPWLESGRPQLSYDNTLHPHHHYHPYSHGRVSPSYTTIQQLPLPAPQQQQQQQPTSELTDQQVKNLLTITAASSSSTGKRRPRKKQDQELAKGQESFVCQHCGKMFAKGYNLKSHLKTHSDERPFHCSFCERSFARNHDKKRHELLHQGVKKFQCGGVLKDKVTRWGCGKRFSRADGLGRHFRTDIGWLCIRPLMLEAKEAEKLEHQHNNHEEPYNVDEVTFGSTFINDLLKKTQ